MTPVPEKYSFNKSAGWGLVLVLPTVFFFGMVASKYILGIDLFFSPFEEAMSNPKGREIINIFSPIIFLGGSLAALVINTLAVAGLKIHRVKDEFMGTLLIKGNVWNLAIIFLSFSLISMLLGYLVAENWQCWVGIKENC